MKIKLNLLLYFLVLFFPVGGQQVNEEVALKRNYKNCGEFTLTDFEKEQGWKLLFDGFSLIGWHGAGMAVAPDAGWTIADCVLQVVEGGLGGDIITNKKFKNFEMVFQFKITKGANSGVKYYVTENEYGKGALGLEYQILDDERHPDAKLGRDGNRTLGSLYDLLPARNKHVNLIGQWNNGKILANNNHIEHWLNGIKILEYERGSDAYLDLVAQSKFRDYKAFGMASEGYILLQDHGNNVFYKNIKIREL